MKPRLLFLVGRFVIGGHATDNIPLLYHLKDKYTVKIVYGQKEADELEPLFLLDQFPGIEVEKLPVLKRRVNPFADVITLLRLYRIIKQFRPDIVHTHGAKAGVTGRVAAWFWGRSVIVHTFHGHLFHSYFHRVITALIITVERLLSRITDAAIALSDTQKNELAYRFKIFPAQKLHVIPLGLFEPAARNFYKRDFRNEYGLLNTDVAIAIIGRIVPIKNHVDFLKIATQVLQQKPVHAKFFIIGDGNGREELVDFLAVGHTLCIARPKPCWCAGNLYLVDCQYIRGDF